MPFPTVSNLISYVSSSCPNLRAAQEADYGQYNPLRLEQLIHRAFHAIVHANQRWPGSRETFARQLVGGVEAHFRAAAQLAGRMVKDVGGAFGEEGVALRIGVG